MATRSQVGRTIRTVKKEKNGHNPYDVNAKPFDNTIIHIVCENTHVPRCTAGNWRFKIYNIIRIFAYLHIIYYTIKVHIGHAVDIDIIDLPSHTRKRETPERSEYYSRRTHWRSEI